MTLHLFYRKIGGLNPYLYAYTCDERLSLAFGITHPNLFHTTRKIKEHDYVVLRNTVSELDDIIEQTLVTRDEDGNKIKVRVVGTEREIQRIIMHGPELVIRELSKKSIQMEFFTGEMQEALEDIFMVHALEYQQYDMWFNPLAEPEYIDWDTDKFTVDQVNLYCQLFGVTENILDTKSKK